MGLQLRLAVGFSLLAIAIGCDSGRDNGWAPVLGGNQPPVIEHLRVEHDDPDAVGRVRAVAEVRDPDGDDVELLHTWTVAGVVLPETGPELELPLARKGTRVELLVTAADGRGESPPAKRVVHLQNPRPEPEQWLGVRDEAEGTPTARPESAQAPSDHTAAASDVAAAIEAVHYAVQVPFAAGASSVRFRLLQGPEGMWVHPASGEVTWVPEAWQTGTHFVEVEISDGSGEVAVEAFRVDSGLEPDEAVATFAAEKPIEGVAEFDAAPEGEGAQSDPTSELPAKLALP